VEGKMNGTRITISGAMIVRMAGLSFFLGLALGIYFATMAGHHRDEEQAQHASSIAPVVYMHHSVSAVPAGLAAG
jgi:hypothetical protein